MTTFVYYLDRVSLLFLFLYIALFTVSRYGKAKTFVIFLISYLLISFLDAIPLYTGVHSFITAIEIVLVQATALIVCQYRDIRAIYIGTSAAAYVLNGDYLCNLIYDFTNHNYWIAFAAQITIHATILFMLTGTTRKQLQEEIKYNDKSWWLLTCVPVLFYLSVLSLSDMKAVPAVTTAANTDAVAILLMLMNITNIVVIQFLEQKTQVAKNESNVLFLETYADGLKKSVDILQRSNEQFSYIRHDIKHFGQMIAELLKNGETDRVYDAIGQISEAVDKSRPILLCENIPANAVLSSYATRSKQSSVEFDCMADIPINLENTNEYEFAAVLANLLDNALHAASATPPDAKRFIRVRILPVKGMLMIEIANSFQGDIKTSRETGLPQSSNGPTHGFGMRSIQAFAQKAGASFVYSISDDTFLVKLAVKM